MRFPRAARLILVVIIASISSFILERAPLAAQSVARLSSKAALAPTLSRWRLVPFGRGLPGSGQWRQGFAIADMNGDGHQDIILPSPRGNPGVPEIFLGDGKGSWSRWRDAKFPRLPYDYGDVQAADLNGDKKIDLVLGIHLRGLVVLLGDGKGGFTSDSGGLDFDDGFSSQAIRVADLDHRGHLGIIASQEGMRINPGGRSGPMPKMGPAIYRKLTGEGWKRIDHPGTGIFSDSLTIGDFNGDGRIDFATGTMVLGRTDLVNLQQPGGDWKATSLDDLRQMSFVLSVVAADFDGDGQDDLAVAYLSLHRDGWRSGIDVFLSRLPNGWERKQLTATPGTDGPIALASGDLNGDGKRDLVALTGRGETWVFLGDGRGNFARRRDMVAQFAKCRGSHVELRDLDGDGRDEIVESFAEASDPENCPTGGGVTALKAVLHN